MRCIFGASQVSALEGCGLSGAGSKSNAFTAYGAVLADIEATAAEPLPLHLRNAPTKLMKEWTTARTTICAMSRTRGGYGCCRQRTVLLPTNEGGRS
jgi:hypothetical protein